ncbi:MAG: hydroxymethylglutaryl-CoA lyase [Myxococcota bacterium]|nr:hydroxymethylglutaryl-CoA lyase [Myxococcota bacterium]
MFEGLPNEVTVYEVGPRDGLQNEKAFVKTEDKVALIDALLGAGLPKVEITSFVHPRWIPALADAGEVARQCALKDNYARCTALVPNEKGLTRALEVKLPEIAVFMSASATHNLRNINKDHEQTFAAFKPVFELCHEQGISVRAYVSTVWGCPYEGEVAPQRTAEISARLLDMGAYQISLGDTIGIGDPRQTAQILGEVGAAVGIERLAMHMHDTRGMALANCLVGLEYGIRTFDSSIAGLGGCPYAPGASGNLATEDLVLMLHRLGIKTGIDIDNVVRAGLMAQAILGRTLPGRALQAFAAERRASAGDVDA